MIRKSVWTKDRLEKVRQLRAQGKTVKEVAKALNATYKSVEHILRRTNWSSLSDGNSVEPPKQWTNDEMLQMDAFLTSGKSYSFIAEQLGRSMRSVECKAQATDWQAWKKLKAVSDNESTNIEKNILANNLANAILNICRYDVEKLNILDKKSFLSKVNLEDNELPVQFQEIKNIAKKELEVMGFGNPECVEYGEGTYIIVGDSHGKHTKSEMFRLLTKVNKYIKPDKIIHIGHILDDDNDISYNWGNFSNLVVLSKVEELKIAQDQRNKFKFTYDIVRESIYLGDLAICNQDIISDYVKTAIKSLDNTIFEEKAIVNCHRLEFCTRSYNNGYSYFASPGCLCEGHIIRTVKQMDFTDGKVVKQAFWDGFSKYRRMKHMNKYWEMGMLVVHVNKNKEHTIIPCAIKRIKDYYATSYFDKIISSHGVYEPDKKIFINADLHCDNHDPAILDVQEQICKDYKPDITVNLGDTHNYNSLNHHIMDRGGVILDKKVLDEAAQTHYVLKRITEWAKDNYLICGNHERFASDFIEKYPQFKDYLDIKFLCDLDSLKYKTVEIKSVLKIGNTKFVHGEMRMYGQNGSKLEKASKTFGGDVFIGHIHRPEIRFGCYSVGLSGKLDQSYNEPEASDWMHGFGLCNHYQGKSWSTTIAITNNKCIINNKQFSPNKVDSWNPKNYKAKLSYSI